MYCTYPEELNKFIHIHVHLILSVHFVETAVFTWIKHFNIITYLFNNSKKSKVTVTADEQSSCFYIIFSLPIL